MPDYTKKRPEKPDLVVGIDFGLTGTAVAWALPSQDKVNSMKTWPDMINDARKVPSAIVLEGSNRESSWGFSAHKYDGQLQHPVHSLFKAAIGLDDQPQGDNNADDSAHPEKDIAEEFSSDENKMDIQTAVECLTAYLAGLYAYIKKELSRELRGKAWRSIRAWFLFSYPTTWENEGKERFRNIVESSDFGRENDHWVNALHLDEAQAAMASFSTEGSRPAPEKVIVIADIGGGTTDVNTYVVEKDNGKHVKLKVENRASGRNHGSVHVDYKVATRLRSDVLDTLSGADNQTLRKLTPDDIKTLAETETAKILAGTAYLLAKHKFDVTSPRTRELPFALFLDGIFLTTVKFELNTILREEFENQCRQIWDQIEQHSKGSVDQLVLTGGLSNNAFVRAWFDDKIRESQKTTKPIGEIIFLREPETTVSKGLVHDALESIKRDGLWLYKSLHSYGIVVYDSCGEVEAKQKFLEKGKLVEPKKFKEKQTVRFKLADGRADLCLARWDIDNEDDSITNLGSLTKDLPDSTRWESSWTPGSAAKTEAELTFERRTVTITFWSKDPPKDRPKEKTKHKRVFNEEWHEGAAPTSPNNTVRYASLARIGLGIASLIAVIVNIALGGGLDEIDDGGDADKPQNDGKGGRNKASVLEDDANGAGGGGGHDDFVEEVEE
ncbi:hypothetical protein CcaCcLH18_10031 [Colletotrichum camelliae]|nr:hypothetical protein CcaCcLH18_10031 [Colletotrichum camelliae]